ncbi:MAG: hypothetical protein AAF530_23135 [Pseudomonadota bacterium]
MADKKPEPTTMEFPDSMPELDNSDVGAGADKGVLFIGAVMVVLILLAIFGL